MEKKDNLSETSSDDEVEECMDNLSETSSDDEVEECMDNLSETSSDDEVEECMDNLSKTSSHDEVEECMDSSGGFNIESTADLISLELEKVSLDHVLTNPMRARIIVHQALLSHGLEVITPDFQYPVSLLVEEPLDLLYSYPGNFQLIFEIHMRILGNVNKNAVADDAEIFITEICEQNGKNGFFIRLSYLDIQSFTNELPSLREKVSYKILEPIFKIMEEATVNAEKKFVDSLKTLHINSMADLISLELEKVSRDYNLTNAMRARIIVHHCLLSHGLKVIKPNFHYPATFLKKDSAYYNRVYRFLGNTKLIHSMHTSTLPLKAIDNDTPIFFVTIIKNIGHGGSGCSVQLSTSDVQSFTHENSEGLLLLREKVLCKMHKLIIWHLKNYLVKPEETDSDSSSSSYSISPPANKRPKPSRTSEPRILTKAEKEKQKFQKLVSKLQRKVEALRQQVANSQPEVTISQQLNLNNQRLGDLQLADH